MYDYDDDIMTLSQEEMDLIQDTFINLFPNRIFTVFHQTKSKIAQIDLCVLYKKNKGAIIYTVGMSNFIMEDDTSCEVFVEVPDEMFNFEPTEENCKNRSIEDLIHPDYLFILSDLLYIAIMPSHGDLYQSGDSIGLYRRKKKYGLLEFFRKENPYKDSVIKFMFLTQLDIADMRYIQDLSSEEREEYFSKLIGPVRKDVE